MSEIVEKALREKFPDDVIECKDAQGVLDIKINKTALAQICRMLHDDLTLGFDYLADVTSVDWNDRIEVIYRLVNLANSDTVILRCDLDRSAPEVDSLCDIWRGADYQEREVYDLMGVVFNGHPELERILLPRDWEGYPLRKDYVIPD